MLFICEIFEYFEHLTIHNATMGNMEENVTFPSKNTFTYDFNKLIVFNALFPKFRSPRMPSGASVYYTSTLGYIGWENFSTGGNCAPRRLLWDGMCAPCIVYLYTILALGYHIVHIFFFFLHPTIHTSRLVCSRSLFRAGLIAITWIV